MKIYSYFLSIVAQTCRTIRRLLMWHPYRLSAAVAVLSTGGLALLLISATRTHVMDIPLFMLCVVLCLVSWPFVAHFAGKREAEHRGEHRRKAAEEARNKHIAEQPTMLIPLFVPEPPAPKVESIYFSARYVADRVADRDVEIVRQRLAAEMAESTGDIRS